MPIRGAIFDPIICREDGPVKPHLRAIWKICEAWDIHPRQCVVIGDHRFDILAGRNASSVTVLFTGSGQPSGLESGESADYTLGSFAEPAAFWQWMDQIDLGGVGASC